MVGVEQAQGLRDPRLQISPVALEGLCPADVDVPQIEGWGAFGDPMRQRHARTTGADDADGVVAGGDPVAGQLRRLPQIVAAVGGEALRPVEEGVDADPAEHRHAVHPHLQDRLEMVEILRQRVEAEIGRDAGHAPRLGARLEGAEHQLAGVFLVVGALVRHAQHRQPGQAGNRLGDDVEVLAGMQRQRDADLRRQVARPHAPAIDHHLGGDPPGLLPGRPGDAGDAAAACLHAGDGHALADQHPAQAGTLGQRQRHIGRVGLPVVRQMDRAGDAVDAEIGVVPAQIVDGDFRHRHVEGAGQGGLGGGSPPAAPRSAPR